MGQDELMNWRTDKLTNENETDETDELTNWRMKMKLMNWQMKMKMMKLTNWRTDELTNENETDELMKLMNWWNWQMKMKMKLTNWQTDELTNENGAPVKWKKVERRERFALLLRKTKKEAVYSLSLK